MPDWNTRLKVSYVDEDGNEVEITPIDSFTPSFSLPSEVLHSIEDTHIGVIYTPQNISFSLTVRAIGDAAAKLTVLALQGKRFEITLDETDTGGSDWSFSTLVLGECIITSAAPSAATVSGAPTATFSGFSLKASADPKTGDMVEIPA